MPWYQIAILREFVIKVHAETAEEAIDTAYSRPWEMWDDFEADNPHEVLELNEDGIPMDDGLDS